MKGEDFDPRNAHGRALYKGCGFTRNDLKKPRIAIVNSWNEINPGHIHLRELAEMVKKSVRKHGGTPMEFNTIALCDGIVNSGKDSNYLLPTREIIAASVEGTIKAHDFDGMVMLCSSDKVISGMLIAAARCDIPTVFLTGGTMEPKKFTEGVLKGKTFVSCDIIEAIGEYNAEKISKEEFELIESQTCGSAGACNMMGAANTMACVVEAMGLSLPGCATMRATSPQRMELCEETGRIIMEITKSKLSARTIITKESIENAIKLGLACGGSTSMILHLCALSHEMGGNLDHFFFDHLSKKIPLLAKFKPDSMYNLDDFHDAGGVKVLMKKLSSLLDLSTETIMGITINYFLSLVEIQDFQVIRNLEDPIQTESGVAVLKGNLAPEGAIVKYMAINPKMMHHNGKAKVFETEEQIDHALTNNNIKQGDILIIRYQGPKGAPGMREFSILSAKLIEMELDDSVIIITDGRYSGFTRGPWIEHVCPEAFEGGPIAIVMDGDEIEIDIPNRALNIKISSLEIKKRIEEWIPPKTKINSGYLRLYRKNVSSARYGAHLLE